MHAFSVSTHRRIQPARSCRATRWRESRAWSSMRTAVAAPGLRVGWSVGPPLITPRMRDILGHIGAWAPRPEQVAVAKFLGMASEIDSFHEHMIRELQLRLNLLYDGFESMRSEGLPVRAIAPQGAIYLSAQFQLAGRSNEEIRKLLLDEAGFAAVPL